MDTAADKWKKYKPQVMEFFNSIKDELAKSTKENEEKDINFQIEGGSDSTNGIGMHTYTIKANEYSQIIGNPQPYMAEALAMVTLSINSVNAEGVGILESLFNSMTPMLDEMPVMKHILGKGEYKLRIDGTKISVDFVVKSADELKNFLELGINPADFHSLKLMFGTALKLGDIFELPFDQLLEKLFSLHFSIDQNLINITYLAKAAITALEKVHIPEDKIQKKIKKAIFYIKAYRTFISAKFALKYSPKEAAEFAMKSPMIDNLGGKEVLAEQFEQYKIMAEQMGKEMIKGTLESMGFLEAAKAANIDNIIIAFVFPKYQTGIVQEFKFPGITALFNEKFL